MITLKVGWYNLADAIVQISENYPDAVNRAQNSFELGDPGGLSPYKEALRRIDSSIGRLKRLRAEMQELAGHVHEWGDRDYCIWCGADGRA